MKIGQKREMAMEKVEKSSPSYVKGRTMADEVRQRSFEKNVTYKSPEKCLFFHVRLLSRDIRRCEGGMDLNSENEGGREVENPRYKNPK